MLNRFTQRSLGIDEKEIGKALTLQPQWKVPSDYETTQLAQNTASALALKDSSISRVIRQMARTACGLPKNPEKKKGFQFVRMKARQIFRTTDGWDIVETLNIEKLKVGSTPRTDLQAGSGEAVARQLSIRRGRPSPAWSTRSSVSRKCL